MQHSRVHLSTAAFVRTGMSKEACSAMHAMFFQSVFTGYNGFPQSGYTCQFVLCEASLTDTIPHRDSLRPRQQRPFHLQGLEIQTPRIEKLDYAFFKDISIWLSPQCTAKKNCLYRVLGHTLMIRWSVTVVNQDVNFYIIHMCLHIRIQPFILNVKIFVILSPVTQLTQVRLRGHVH